MLTGLYILFIHFLVSLAPPGKAQTLSFSQLRSRTMDAGSDTLYVVNFWATWCQPCVEEIPYFEKAGTEFAGKPIKILLVSLDFQSDKDKVNAFIADHHIRNEVYLLDAGNPDKWIDSVDTTWSGAIPATVLYRNGGKTAFHEGGLSQAQLDSMIRSHIK